MQYNSFQIIQENNYMQQENISAKAWILMDSKNQVYLRGFNTQQKREIASLTKMYTLYACLTLNQIISVNPQNLYLQVFNANICGTSANLLPFQYISVHDLYYALMLPSGNDAASVLAFYYGSWLVTKKTFAGQAKSVKKESVGDRLKYNQLYTKKFVQFMNNFIVKQSLHHVATHFQNCHGLSDKNQVSNAWQLAEASLKFIKHPVCIVKFSCLFRFAVVGPTEGSITRVRRGFNGRIQIFFCTKDTEVSQTLFRSFYINIGIKTGHTTTAGGCLSSITSIHKDKYEQQELLVIVIGSKDSEYRFKDTKLIVADYQKYIQMMKL